MKCVLHVTEQEYIKVLQFNHSSLVLNNRDEKLLYGLETLFGRDVAHEVRRSDECWVQKHYTLGGIPRVEVCRPWRRLHATHA